MQALVLLSSILYLSQSSSLTRIPPHNAPPPSRVYLFTDYNSATNSLLIFGGNQGISTVFHDVWLFNITSGLYFNLVPTNDQLPDKRFNCGGFVDSSTNSLFVFGGITSSGPQDDLWRFDLNELKWHEVKYSGDSPSPRYRYGYTKFYVGSKLKFLVFAGATLVGESNDVYLYDVTSNSWENINGTGQVPPNIKSPLVEVVNGVMYVFAGDRPSDGVVGHNDTFSMNLTTLVWKKLNLTGSYHNRYLAGSSSTNTSLVLYFGWSDQLNGNVPDIMTLNLSNPITWEAASISTSCLSMDSFGFSKVNSSLYIFGGYLDGSLLNSLIQVTQDWNCVAINQASFTPQARMFQSMVSINGKLIMYGGQGISSFLDDLWVYDIEADEWTVLKIEGVTPGARAHHSSGAQGDTMVIWGGVSSNGYLNDLFIFSASEYAWTSFTPEGIIPSGRKDACLVLMLPKIYIFGGESTSGRTNELWVYDTGFNNYTKLEDISLSGIYVMNNSFSSCVIDNGDFIVIFGSSDGEEPIGSVYAFNLESYTWRYLYQNDKAEYSRSMALVQYIEGKIVVIGGQAWNTDPFKDSFMVDLNGNSTSSLIGLSEYHYGGASAMFKSSVYYFGGGTMIGTTMRLSVPSYNFFMYDLKDFAGYPNSCSPGSYMSQGTCVICPKGAYCESYGSSNYTLCPPGTFNYLTGASSLRQCYPCDENSYAPNNGSSYCIDCPKGSYCPIGSTNFSPNTIMYNSKSGQPLNYSPDLDDLNNDKTILYTSISFSVLLVCLLVRFNRAFKDRLKIIDLFKALHNYKLDAPMIMKKNRIGGLFSLLFMFVAVLLIVAAVLDYQLNNIRESKALVPLVILANEVDSFTGQLSIDLKIFTYGGDCVNQDSETEAYITINSVYYSSVSITGYKLADDCYVELLFSDCSIETGAYILYEFQEASSYAAGLGLNLTSSSSIPNELSSIRETLIPDTNTLFRGFIPTTFNILVTPSLFQPEDTSDLLTGFHLALSSTATKGTMYKVSQLPFSAGLKVLVSLNKSSNGLFTIRTKDQTLLLLFNTLIGSVFGVLGAMGSVMRTVESQYKNYLSNKKAEIATLRGTRKSLKTQGAASDSVSSDDEKLDSSLKDINLSFERT